MNQRTADDRSRAMSLKAIVNTVLLAVLVIGALVLFFVFQGRVERLL